MPVKNESNKKTVQKKSIPNKLDDDSSKGLKNVGIWIVALLFPLILHVVANNLFERVPALAYFFTIPLIFAATKLTIDPEPKGYIWSFLVAALYAFALGNA